MRPIAFVSDSPTVLNATATASPSAWKRRWWLTAFLVLACDVSGVGETNSSEDYWIAFSSSRTGEGDVYAVTPKGDAPVLLAGTTAPEGTVRYDPARNRLVYHRFEDDRSLLVADGEVLFVDPNGDVAPAWSPLGELVVALENEVGGDLFLIDTTGVNRVQLTQDPFVERYPSWSPEGDRIVYAKRLTTGWDLHVLDVSSRKETRITFDGIYVGHPAWSPDGQRVAFDTMIDGDAEIAVIELQTGQVTTLIRRAGNDLVPSWSPDGRSIAFGGAPAGSDNWDVWLFDVTTAEVARLTRDPANDGGPIFVPRSVIRASQAR